MSPIGTAAGVYTSACLPKYNARVFVDEGSRDSCSRDSRVSELRLNELNQGRDPHIFNLRPDLLKFIVHVIRFITNRKYMYAFYCIY